MEFKRHRYVIQRPDKTAADGAVADDDDDDDDDDDGNDDNDDDDSRCERSILVMDVPDDVIDEVVSVLENESNGGGEVELSKRNSYTGALLVTFVSKDGQYCERHWDAHICILHCSLFGYRLYFVVISI